MRVRAGIMFSFQWSSWNFLGTSSTLRNWIGISRPCSWSSYCHPGLLLHLLFWLVSGWRSIWDPFSGSFTTICVSPKIFNPPQSPWNFLRTFFLEGNDEVQVKSIVKSNKAGADLGAIEQNHRYLNNGHCREEPLPTSMGPGALSFLQGGGEAWLGMNDLKNCSCVPVCVQ